MPTIIPTRPVTQVVVEDIPAVEVIERLVYLIATVGQPVAEARRIVVNEVAEHLTYGGMPEADAEQLAAESVDRVAPWAAV